MLMNTLLKQSFSMTIKPLFNTEMWNKELSTPLKDLDDEVFDIIEKEKLRQIKGIELIPSENFCSVGVLDALGSIMQNKYSEGYPGKRYYGGNEHIDEMENLCISRALEAFDLDPNEWGVNVQPLSGSPANFQAYNAILEPHDRIMSLDLPHGGHLSHGYQTPKKKISIVSKYFETFPYRLNEKTGIIDYDMIERNCKLYNPKLIVAGASAYPRIIDYKRIREIADEFDTYLLSDMAHVSGLVAAKVIPSPFKYADIVTTTTHKSLRGPRHAMIFYRKGERILKKKSGKIIKKGKYELEKKINESVFPGCQGGPHNHSITALAVALKLAQSKNFKEYQVQVLKNSKVLADSLMEMGYDLVSGGTDNHLLLLDLHKNKIDGARVEKVLDLCGIAANKNTVPGDKSALVPGGIRMGSPPMTTRGLLEKDFKQIAVFVDKAIKIAIQTKKEARELGNKKFKDYEKYIEDKEVQLKCGISQLQKEVEEFSLKYYVVGFKKDEMKYKPKQ